MEQKKEIKNKKQLINWIDNSETCYVSETGEDYFVIEAPNNATWQIQYEKGDKIDEIIYQTIKQLKEFDADEQFAEWWHKDFEYSPSQFIKMLQEDEESFCHLAYNLREFVE